jgi:hypothetical protein
MLATGRTLAGYRVEGVLGGGGMGVVYEATQLSLERTVALKVLAPHLSADPEFAARFRREAMLQAALDHPNIVPVYEAGESEDGLYLAMKLVRGSDLRRLVADGLEPDGVLDALEQVAGALDAAHEAGSIHRDVKPQNVLVDEDGTAYLADFGLSRRTQGSAASGTGQYLGTLDYVSPEQIQGKQLGPRTDQYAFAVVLHECLTGEVPFPRDTEAALLFAHLSEAPPRVSERRPGLPPALDDVLARGLAKDPEDRFDSVGALVAAARGALAEPVGTAAPGVETNGRARFSETIADPTVLRRAPVVHLEPAPRALPRWLLPLLAALVPLLALLGFWLGHGRAGEPSRPGNVAAAGPLTLAFDDGWRPLATAPAVPGLSLSDPVALASTRRDEPGQVRAGIAGAAEGASLLPAAFLRLLDGDPRAEIVRLGRYDALRYRDLPHRTAGARMTLYAVPTSRGVATVVCLAPLVGPGALARCEAVATSLRLRGAEPQALGPTERYGAAVRRALTRLDRARATGRDALASARRPAGQADAARRLAAAHRAAASTLAGAQPGLAERPAHRAMLLSLQRAAAAYDGLAFAARRNASGTWARASLAVERADQAFRDAFRALAPLGYRIAA